MRKLILAMLTLLLVSIVVISSVTTTWSNPGGAPAGASGSPGDNNLTCAKSGCHTGNTVTEEAGIISSDVPLEGYTPLQTYTITVTIVKAGISRWGFQCSAENSAGAKTGTLILTNASQTRLISSSKFVTHTTAGNSGSTGSKTWTFNWTAPAAATGSVTIYGAVLAGNGNGNESGDRTYKDALEIPEKISTGIQTTTALVDEPVVYPNPVTENEFLLRFETPVREMRSIKLYTMAGQLVREITESELNAGETLLKVDVSGLEAGVYVLSGEYAGGAFVKRIIRR